MSDEPTRTHVPSSDPPKTGTFPPEVASLLKRLDLPAGEATVDAGNAAGTVTGSPDGASSSASVSGLAIPGYEILGELGRGGMGVVFKARQLGLNRVVALKMTAGAAASDGRAVIRFLAEAESIAAVRHPNVVQVYDYGDIGGRPYMALEYCPGGNLTERLRGGPLAASAAAELVSQIAAGVAAAHEQGIVHRDLKPGNVVFGADGVAKVTDFGLAKRAASDLTATQAVMGTPAYMSPEQASGRTKFVGPQADVWALGVILYECLSGTRPFAGGDADEFFARVLGSAPEPLRARAPGTPRDLELICRKCLEKEPTDRYLTAMEFTDDLQRFIRGEPVTPRQTGAFQQLRRWGCRNRVVAMLSGAVLLLLVVGSIATGIFAYRASEAAAAARARAEERDQAIRKQQELIREFMRFLAGHQGLSREQRLELTQQFLAAHPEIDNTQFSDTFMAQTSQAGAAAAVANAPILFGD